MTFVLRVGAEYTPIASDKESQSVLALMADRRGELRADDVSPG